MAHGRECTLDVRCISGSHSYRSEWQRRYTPEQMIRQWEYLGRKGKLELHLSARHLDSPLRPDKLPETARSWALETSNYIEDLPDEERDQDQTRRSVQLCCRVPYGSRPSAPHVGVNRRELLGQGVAEEIPSALALEL